MSLNAPAFGETGANHIEQRISLSTRFVSSVDFTKTASSHSAGGVSDPDDNETKADNLSMQLSMHGL